MCGQSWFRRISRLSVFRASDWTSQFAAHAFAACTVSVANLACKAGFGEICIYWFPSGVFSVALTLYHDAHSDRLGLRVMPNPESPYRLEISDLESCGRGRPVVISAIGNAQHRYPDGPHDPEMHYDWLLASSVTEVRGFPHPASTRPWF